MTTLQAQSDAIFGPRGDRAAVEEGRFLTPKFDENGLVAAVAVDATDGEVLMLAWMNAEALALTIKTGEAHYWSRSRAEIWHKGATSGNVQEVVEIRVDCDQDAVVLKVNAGPACHVGYRSCFFRAVEPIGKAAANRPARLVTKAQKAYDPSKVYGGG